MVMVVFKDKTQSLVHVGQVLTTLELFIQPQNLCYFGKMSVEESNLNVT